MTETFGEAYTDIPATRRDWQSKFLISFEKAKQKFDGPKFGRVFETFSIDMECPISYRYDAEEWSVHFSR
jgi:hypothetical protein